MTDGVTTEHSGRMPRLDRVHVSVQAVLGVLLSLVMIWAKYQHERIDDLESEVDMLRTTNFEVQLGISDNLGAIRSDIRELTTTVEQLQRTVETLRENGN